MAKMACAQCGGAKRMKAGGTSTEDPVSKKTIRQSMRADKKMDRQDKKWDRKYEKQKAEELMKSKRFKEGGMTGIVGMPKYGNNPNTQEGRMLKNGGAFAPNRAVQASCKNGMVRDENGRCVMQRMMQTGGTATNKKSSVSDTGMRIRSASPIGQAKRGGATKAAKFAALAPPYNKATAADRIAGAKKNARKNN